MLGLNLLLFLFLRVRMLLLLFLLPIELFSQHTINPIISRSTLFFSFYYFSLRLLQVTIHILQHLTRWRVLTHAGFNVLKQVVQLMGLRDILLSIFVNGLLLLVDGNVLTGYRNHILRLLHPVIPRLLNLHNIIALMPLA